MHIIRQLPLLLTHSGFPHFIRWHMVDSRWKQQPFSLKAVQINLLYSLANNLQAFFKLFILSLSLSLFLSLCCRLRNGNSTRIKECINFPCSVPHFFLLLSFPLLSFYWDVLVESLELAFIWNTEILICVRFSCKTHTLSICGWFCWNNTEIHLDVESKNLPTAKRNDQN